MEIIYNQKRITQELMKQFPTEMIRSSLKDTDFTSLMTDHMKIWKEQSYTVGKPVENIGWFLIIFVWPH